MKDKSKSLLEGRRGRVAICCLCTLLLVESFALFVMTLGPGLASPLPNQNAEQQTEQSPQPGEESNQGSGSQLGQDQEPNLDSSSQLGQDQEPNPDPEQQAEINRIEQERKTARKEAADRGLLVLINKTNSVDSNYKPDDLVSIKYYAENRGESGRYMRKEAAEQFHKLVEAAAEQDLEIVLTTAYRSYGFQQILWNNYVAKDGEAAASKYSARPGTSEHQSGLAVDVSSPSVSYELTQKYADTAEGKWLAENAHKFGFIIRYPKDKENITGYMYEPWHLRYVSRSVAEEIYEANISLEEYIEKFFKD